MLRPGADSHRAAAERLAPLLSELSGAADGDAIPTDDVLFVLDELAAYLPEEEGTRQFTAMIVSRMNGAVIRG